MTPEQALQNAREQNVEFFDLRFLDYPGHWQTVSMPMEELTEKCFESGVGFDGSVIRGWGEVNEGDMLLMPIAETGHMDPFTVRPTMGFICDIKNPVTKKTFSRDPRSVARKAEKHLRDSGVADTAMLGPEVEFFVFDHVRFDQTVNAAWHEVDSPEGTWKRGEADPTNTGYHVSVRTGQFPAPPLDRLHDVRAEMVSVAKQIGLVIEQHHHEVATGGQCEIDLRYRSMVRAADDLLMLKHVVRNVAARHGKTATFMPKPLWGDNGSGMHTHFSLWKDSKNIFAGNAYAGLSKKALYAIGGILKHAPALAAFTSPTTNSFKRLTPGFEAPIHLVYASRNRGAAIRVPVYQDNPDTKRLEVRMPDPSCNPYLAYAAMTMAALDGIKRKIDPGDPFDRAMADLDSEEYANIPRLPLSLDRALDALEADHAFLTDGGVFSEELIRFWVLHKREDEVEAIRQRPHPYEFSLYYGV